MLIMKFILLNAAKYILVITESVLDTHTFVLVQPEKKYITNMDCEF